MPVRQKNRSSEARNRARAARKHPSTAEEIAWHWLRNSRLGFKFRREYPVLTYRLDFYCPEARLAVEFDGEQHDPLYDRRRDSDLARLGIEVLRIPNRSYFLLDDSPIVDHFNLIRETCEKRTGRAGTPFEVF